MTKRTMIKWYRNKSVADAYILGYIANGNICFNIVDEIMPRYLNVEKASRNQGENLRLRLRTKNKQQLMRKEYYCLGSADQLNQEKYNKGEIFEKLVTEFFGQKWEKDNIPFWIQGDICVENVKIQIKFDGATLTNTKQIEKFKKER